MSFGLHRSVRTRYIFAIRPLPQDQIAALQDFQQCRSDIIAKVRRRPPRIVPPADVVDLNLAPGLDLNSEASNYIRWIADLVTPHLSGRVLEIGAGRGDFTAIFQERAEIVATELHDGGIAHLRKRFSLNLNVQVRPFDLFGEHDEQFDSTVLINVLEHIQDDEGALKSIHALLRPGGRVILYVPAFWILYSRFDNSIGHYRRYRRKELVSLVRLAGFEVRDSHYVNA